VGAPRGRDLLALTVALAATAGVTVGAGAFGAEPTPTPGASAARALALAEFEKECIRAFKSSAGDEYEDGALAICGCAARDAREAKIPASVLRKETAEIRKDPRHPIRDKNLLESFHYCTVQAMHQARETLPEPRPSARPSP
jgi:hypothetical protein